MALVTPYCTVEEANAYLVGSTDWGTANTATKNNALFWGRIFIDSNYSCAYFDPDVVPDEIKYANALLAEDYIQDKLIDSSANLSGRMTKKRVKAGSVESETEWLPGSTYGSDQDDVDRLLYGLCQKKGAVKRIIRG